MDTKELFKRCINQATAVVDQVRPEDYYKPTPNTDWNVRDLLGHMLYELAWVPDMVTGKTIQEVGTVYDGDLIGGALQANWHASANRALDTVVAADPTGSAHLSYGESTVEHYLKENAADMLIHAWDLAEGIGRPITFESAIAAVILAQLEPRRRALAASGLFAEALPVSDDADVQTKLLALVGRAQAWRPAERATP